ncbi:MAG: hydantoinase B/oxoprolinase family protein [Ilumatobacteraceae bacterium]
MPVHLGSMGESVRHVLRANAGSMQPGDVYVLNDPYHGGTHLPDITVVTPVDSPDGDERWFVVASRGHHADVGGISPGSMPPDSRTIDDEGVRLDNVLLVRDGELRESALRGVLAAGDHPARNIDQNLGDLRAQVAANAAGVAALTTMVDEFGLDVVQAYMRHVQANATEAVRRVIDRIDGGTCRYEMDNGAVIQVAVTVDRSDRTARVDFTGTSPQRDDNFNAPTSVTRAAVLYVFRTLVDDDIPLNEGCLAPIEIVIPPGSMLDPAPPAGRGRRQRRDVAVRRRCALPGARCRRRVAGNDEQRHVRQRAPPVLRDGRRRIGCGRRLRRRVVRADPHDELPPDRSGDPGVAVPGLRRVVLGPCRFRWRRPLARRRRRRAAHPIRRADASQLALHPSPRRALRPRRWRRRRHGCRSDRARMAR